MKRMIAAASLMMLLTLPLTSMAADAPVPEGPYRVMLQPGEIFKVCLSNEILCPAVAPVCDDLSVAIPVDTPDGLGFKGVGPGETLCSAANPSGARRVFRIEVRLLERK